MKYMRLKLQKQLLRGIKIITINFVYFSIIKNRYYV